MVEDARWWLTESRGDVKNTLTVSIHQTERAVVIDSWEWVGRQDGNQHVAHVACAPFTIPFQDLFLRKPAAGSREEDLVFDVEELKYMAYMIWQVCGNV